jgi:hypothetical protein
MSADDMMIVHVDDDGNVGDLVVTAAAGVNDRVGRKGRRLRYYFFNAS